MKTPTTNRRSFLKVAPIAAFAAGVPAAVAANATRDEADASAGLAVRHASNAVGRGNVPIYATAVGMPSLSVPAGTSALRVSGYGAAGDGADALYRKVASQPAHSGKFQTRDGAWWELVPPFNAAMFGVIADGVTDAGTSLANAIATAQFLDQPLELPAGDIAIDTPLSTITIPVDTTLDMWSRGKTRLLINAGSPACIDFSGEFVATNLTLTAAVAWGDMVINVNDASLAHVGDILFLNTDTQVEASYGYDKQMLGVIASINANAVTLVEPANFDFSALETFVSISRSGMLRLRGIGWKCALGKCVAFTSLKAPYICDATLEGTAVRAVIDCLLLRMCEGLRGERLRLMNSRYSINVSNASRNSEFSDIYAEGLQHPIDANNWAYNTTIRRITGVNNTAIVECHPSFETKFEDVVDVIVPDQKATLVGLRCYGGHAKRVRSVDTSLTPVGGTGGVISLPAYRYLGQKYDRVYEDIVGLRGGLGAREVNGFYIRRCAVNSIDIDITNDVGFVEVDDRTTANIVNVRRAIQRTAPRAEPIVLPVVEEWGARGTVAGITAVTNSNPGVIVAPAHGRSDGDVVRVDGVVGMTQINKRTFTIANATADTFELCDTDTIAYPRYVSGGKVASGVIMKAAYVKQVPYLGWWPTLHYKAVLRNSSAHVGATSLTIPFKLKHNYGFQELGSGYRELEIVIRAFSRNRGLVIARYPLMVFHGSRSSLTIGSAVSLGNTGTITAVVDNAAPHFFTEIVAEGGDAGTEHDQFYLTADAVVSVTHASDVIDLVELEVLERRIGIALAGG